MRVYFDLSTVGPWDHVRHVDAWEQFLERASAHSTDLIVSDRPENADVVIHTGAAGAFDSSVRSMLRPLARSDVSRFVWDWGDAPLGRFSGFYCSLPHPLFDSRRHRTMSYPIIFNELIEHYPLEDALYDFSFVGGVTAGVRQRIFNAFAGESCPQNAIVKVQAASWNSILGRGETTTKREYANSIRQSRFVLCPRGAGAGSVRLFETMRAGRVPVIISDVYVLPAGIDWECCSLRIREADVKRIPGIIEANRHKWLELAASARRLWLDNFSDRHVFGYLATHLSDMIHDMREVQIRNQISYSVKVAAQIAVQKFRPTAGRLRRAFAS